MFSQRNSSPVTAPGDQRLDGLVSTHWALAICPGCGHEQPHGENHRATCPGCGTPLLSFPLYRELRTRDLGRDEG